MPFKSQAQRGFMYAKHPKLAKEFEAETPENAKLPEHVKKMAEGGVVSRDAKDLADIAASGMPIAADPEMMQAGLDAAEIPEEIKNLIEAVHQERAEARPDEGWRIRPSERPESEVPYKRNEERPSIMDQMRGLGMADGGVVPFDVDGGDSDTVKMNGMVSAVQPPDAAPVAPAPAPAPMKPMPAAPAMPPAVSGAKPAIPGAPQPPALTDQDFMNKANSILGLNPQEQAGFMKLLGQNQKNAQIGAGIAGIGDAIAAGGTLGKVNPGGLNRSEDIASNATKEGIEGMQTIRGNQEKAQELADKLEQRDPNSPISKWAQKAYGSVGKKLGLDLSHASAQLIGDVAGKGVDALNTEFQNQLKMMQLDLQKKQLAATVENQKAERQIAEEGRTSEAAKTLANRGIINTIEGIVPGTAANTAKKVLESQAEAGLFAPDVMAYSAKHGITPEQAQAIKDSRTRGK